MRYNFLEDGLEARQAKSEDHGEIIAVLREWWSGRDLTHLMPRLFLDHFCNTSLIINKGDHLVGFMIGFMSPSKSNEGYVHFVGVHPDFRGLGIASFMYQRFFTLCKDRGRDIVRACTSPVNRVSIAFHQALGFRICSGNSEIDGFPVTLDYNRPDDPKVLFVMQL